ncbi:hypothetical protein [Cellulomonas sp.]|uniref:hypothetical protein n=1 Tax=Cellulomonas sp. TaxID=40001 RepID=UPI001AFD6BE9|nr:hypothetical protein [Cellulomonas sp.]MBO9556313.1 hypothetical protein [Cellulomonas sp.]
MRGRSAVAVLSVAVLSVAVLPVAGCGLVGGGGSHAGFENYTDQQVTVSITGTDHVLALPPASDAQLSEGGCVGSGVVVTRDDGTVIASFDGKICPTTHLMVRADWNVYVTDDLTTSAPGS